VKKVVIIVLAVLLITPLVIYYAFPGVLYGVSIWMQRHSGGLEKKTVKVQDHQIVYLEGGKGDTILLLHGFTANKDVWTQFAKFLTPHYHVIALDLPGCGESSKINEQSYDIASQIQRLDQFVSTLGVKQLHIVGSSMGGAISGCYAAHFPDKVLTLGLFNTAGVMSCEKSELFKLFEKGENPLLVETPEQLDKKMELVFEQPPKMPKPLKRIWLKQSIADRPFNEKVGRDLFGKPYLLENDLSKVKAYTLILWGDKDRQIDVSCTKPLEAGIKKSRTVIMKNCGHVPMVERPEETAQHYLSFIQGLVEQK
jgi:pimeloyl-ACP methyl ester carboxylesterase